MKTTGSLWNQYLESWPEDQYFDDSDELCNGVEMPANVQPTDEITFTCGVVFSGRDDYEGKDLVRHFSKWLRSQSNEEIICSIPKEKIKEFKTYLKSIGGKTS